MRKSAWLPFAFALACACGAPAEPAPTPDDTPKTPLDQFIARKDDSYAFELKARVDGVGTRAFVLRLTSQTWRSAAEVDAPLWRHDLIIVRPTMLTCDRAFLYLNGGDTQDPTPTGPDDLFEQLAAQTGCIVAELRQVPNQPLRFADEQAARSEDEILAYTWAKVMDTGDPTWNARFPMVKSAARAMDAIQAFLKTETGAAPPRFVVGGGSKRGWTTWLTGVVDKRVEAIVPLVIDVLNVTPSFQHHFAAYGFYARAVADYVKQGIMTRVGTPAFDALMKDEDPYSYRERLTLPKYIVNASGDQFFLPDSSRFYYDDLQGDKLLRYVPNAEHSLGNTDAAQGVVAFFGALVNDRPRPRYSWRQEGEDQLVVRAEGEPLTVKLWQAQNDKARDFRVDTIGRSWKSTPLAAESPGQYRARVPRPAQGFAAFFIELTYPSGELFPFTVTTPVRVVPDTLPFADRDPRTGTLEGQR